jgi:hypothetical protein
VRRWSDLAKRKSGILLSGFFPGVIILELLETDIDQIRMDDGRSLVKITRKFLLPKKSRPPGRIYSRTKADAEFGHERGYTASVTLMFLGQWW